MKSSDGLNQQLQKDKNNSALYYAGVHEDKEVAPNSQNKFLNRAVEE